MDPLNLPTHPGHLTISPYNRPAFALFSFIGLLLQIPVITSYGLTRKPNVPVVVISAWFFYLTLSCFIAAVAWTGNDPENWWHGKGWCDIDIRLSTAGSAGMLMSQCVANFNLLQLLRDSPRVLSDKQNQQKILYEAIACLAIPTAMFIVCTFATTNRYDVVEYLGCKMNGDSSVGSLLGYILWGPILSVLCLATFIMILYRIYVKGRTASLEGVSFIPDMTVMQFVRLGIFATVVTLVVCPLSLYVGITNLIALSSGMTASAWAHGKPAGWDVIHILSWQQLKETVVLSGSNLNPAIGLAMTLKIVNVSLSYIFFVCFGTGAYALSRYKDIAMTIGILPRDPPLTDQTAVSRQMKIPRTGRSGIEADERYDNEFDGNFKANYSELYDRDSKFPQSVLIYEPSSGSSGGAGGIGEIAGPDLEHLAQRPTMQRAPGQLWTGLLNGSNIFRANN